MSVAPDSPPAASWQDQATRWLLLAPAGTVPVTVADRWATTQWLRRLPAGSAVAIVGGRGLRNVAHQADVLPGRTYLALPSAGQPIAVAAPGPGLSWVANSVLAVPSGRYRGHLAGTVAIRLARHAPWLLRAVGQRILLGKRG